MCKILSEKVEKCVETALEKPEKCVWLIVNHVNR
jgi:hypothetical protein